MPNPYVIVNDYELLKEYFVKQGENFAGRPDLSVNNDILGGAYGLVFQNNSWYKSQRRYALHVLRDFGLGRPILQDTIIDQANKMIQLLKEFNGEPVELTPYFTVGAVIISREKIIVGYGYNGMPIGCDDDLMPWGRDSENTLENKYFYVCHAEMNAILNTNSNVSIRGGIMYTTMFPCNECAKLIIQSRMTEVYLKDKYFDKQETQASKKLLQIAGIKFRQFQSNRKTLTLSFK